MRSPIQLNPPTWLFPSASDGIAARLPQHTSTRFSGVTVPGTNVPSRAPSRRSDSHAALPSSRKRLTACPASQRCTAVRPHREQVSSSAAASAGLTTPWASTHHDAILQAIAKSAALMPALESHAGCAYCSCSQRWWQHGAIAAPTSSQCSIARNAKSMALPHKCLPMTRARRPLVTTPRSTSARSARMRRTGGQCPLRLRSRSALRRKDCRSTSRTSCR